MQTRTYISEAKCGYATYCLFILNYHLPDQGTVQTSTNKPNTVKARIPESQAQQDLHIQIYIYKFNLGKNISFGTSTRKNAAKQVMKENGQVMKRLLEFMEDTVMVESFGMIPDGEEYRASPLVVETLTGLMNGLRAQSDKQAMYISKDFGKNGEVPAWIKRFHHFYPSSELEKYEIASISGQARFSGHGLGRTEKKVVKVEKKEEDMMMMGIGIGKLEIREGIESNPEGRVKDSEMEVIVKQEEEEEINMNWIPQMDKGQAISGGTGCSDDLAKFVGKLPEDVMMKLLPVASEEKGKEKEKEQEKKRDQEEESASEEIMTNQLVSPRRLAVEMMEVEEGKVKVGEKRGREKETLSDIEEEERPAVQRARTGKMKSE
ncbi:hypothetical protein JVU11DRAFT_11969 [Chiua virens]|nr:hypothetical protein JVU11DRAFT_11969 [Chiua virens]